MRARFSFFRFFVPKVFIFYLFLSQVALGDEYKAGSLFLEINGDKERVIEIELNYNKAPKASHRLQKLAQAGLYDGVTFHRVIDGFMAQTGDVKFGNIKDYDPTSVGRGGSDFPNLVAEFSSEPFVRGVVGMARSQNPDSANSQFFLMFESAPHLNENYTVVGKVVSGLDVLMNIKKGNPSTGLMYQPDYISRAWSK